MRCGISAAGDARREQLARAAVARLRREHRRDEVAGPGEAEQRLGPRALGVGVAPDLGEDVPGRGAGGVQALRLGRAGREARRVLRGARQLDADRVVGLLAHDPRADEDARQRPREVLVRRGRDESRALGDHLARVRRPADARDAALAEALAQEDRGREPVRRRQALGERDDRAATREPRLREPGDRLADAGRRDAEEDVVRAPEAGLDVLDAQLLGQLDARQVGAVLAILEQDLACSVVRVCSVVRNPPRASSTATAVPNEPAPTTIARLVGSDRLGRERTSGTSPSVRDPKPGIIVAWTDPSFAMPIPSATAPRAPRSTRRSCAAARSPSRSRRPTRRASPSASGRRRARIRGSCSRTQAGSSASRTPRSIAAVPRTAGRPTSRSTSTRHTTARAPAAASTRRCSTSCAASTCASRAPASRCPTLRASACTRRSASSASASTARSATRPAPGTTSCGCSSRCTDGDGPPAELLGSAAPACVTGSTPSGYAPRDTR